MLGDIVDVEGITFEVLKVLLAVGVFVPELARDLIAGFSAFLASDIPGLHPQKLP